MKQLIEPKEPKGTITSPSKLFDNIKKINIDYEQENLIVFYFNTLNKIIDSEILFKGGLSSCIVDPKTLFRHALIRNSNSIIIAHNHPSGTLIPSPEDKEIFQKLQRCGDLLQLQVLDSIIFDKDNYYSIR